MNALLIGFGHIKTTIAGIVGILSGLGMLGAAIKGVTDGGAFDLAPFSAAFAAIGMGVGLIYAKDANKSNAPQPTATASKVAAGLALILAFGMAPGLARAQEAASAPLAVQLTPDLALRLNVSVVAGSYDLTHKAWLGQGQIGGLYALTSKRLLEAGVIAGGSVSFDTESRPLGEVNAGIVSPKLVISPTLSLHAALLYGRRFGLDGANFLRLSPTIEF